MESVAARKPSRTRHQLPTRAHRDERGFRRKSSPPPRWRSSTYRSTRARRPRERRPSPWSPPRPSSPSRPVRRRRAPRTTATPPTTIWWYVHRSHSRSLDYYYLLCSDRSIRSSLVDRCPRLIGGVPFRGGSFGRAEFCRFVLNYSMQRFLSGFVTVVIFVGRCSQLRLFR